jgi:hypothetical protein
VLDDKLGLPSLPDIEIALYGPRGAPSPAALAVKASVLSVLSSRVVPDRAAA